MPSWLVLQLADSAFPTGGFAHSGGLEAAVKLGEIDSDGLRGFVGQVLWQTGCGALPLVMACHEAPSRLAELDTLSDAFLTNHVANRASRTQGRAFASTCAKVVPQRALVEVDEAVRKKALVGHLAPIFGATLTVLGVERTATAQLFVHQTLRGVLSAAVRMGLVGPLEAQRIQHELGDTETRVLSACMDQRVEDLAQPAPLVDLFGANHDRLYARLYQS